MGKCMSRIAIGTLICPQTYRSYSKLVFFAKYVKDDQVIRTCSTNGKEEECLWNVGGKAIRKDFTRKTKISVVE
jgi:hypothetical protein